MDWKFIELDHGFICKRSDGLTAGGFDKVLSNFNDGFARVSVGDNIYYLDFAGNLTEATTAMGKDLIDFKNDKINIAKLSASYFANEKFVKTIKLLCKEKAMVALSQYTQDMKDKHASDISLVWEHTRNLINKKIEESKQILDLNTELDKFFD